MEWPYFDPEYETLSQRIHPPKVVIDNESSDKFSLIKVDSANKHGILLEVVQVLTDLDLTISKAYISSDGGWFMDVFHVNDQLGRKLTDERVIEYIQQSLGAKRSSTNPEVRTCLGRTVGIQSMGEHTAIEMTGSDRPGVISEIFAVLTNLKCNIVGGEMWTHNGRLACVVYVADDTRVGPIVDMEKLSIMKEQLCNVLEVSEDRKRVKTDFSVGLTHTDRRLHQMMFADRDYENNSTLASKGDRSIRPQITIENCKEKDYSVVNIRCKDRPKLVFDTVCTLTDMQYVVFHGTIDSEGPKAIQEYYIRHMDGRTLDTEGEKQKVIRCLEAAIERRAAQGIKLELLARNKSGLLSEVTRIFRENGLSVTQASISTQSNKAVDTFYVTDVSGALVDMKTIEAIRNKIGRQTLLIKEVPKFDRGYSSNGGDRPAFSIGNLLKSQWERLSSNLSVVE